MCPHPRTAKGRLLAACMRLLLGAAGIAAAASTATAVLAQDFADYPSKPIRMIIPQTPGAAADIIGRMIAPKLGELVGQQLVIDNRAGAGGLIGTEIAAKSVPDGYSVLLGASAWMTIAPHTYKKVPYDALGDFIPVSLCAIGQNLLFVNPGTGVSSVEELIALMKAKPNQINMASAGVGSASHLAGLLFTTQSGTRAVHVPYKGAGLSVLAVISGEAEWSFSPMQAPLPHVRAGKLRALAVGGSSRSPILPDVPTVAESGIPDYYSATWYGILVPKGTPNAIVAKLHEATVRAIGTAELSGALLAQGAEPKTGSSEDFARFIREDYESAGKLVKLAGVTAE